jgi:hypothetical protein
VLVIRGAAVQSSSAGGIRGQPRGKESEARRVPNGRRLWKDQEAAVGQQRLVPVRRRSHSRPA